MIDGEVQTDDLSVILNTEEPCPCLLPKAPEPYELIV